MSGTGQPNGNANGSADQRVTWPQMAQFNTTDPERWIMCAESLLRMFKVTDPTVKCRYIVSKMDAHALREVRDLIADLLVLTPVQYEELKKNIIQRFGASQTVKIQGLLEGEEIGDRTPSQILRHLRAQAGNAMSDDVLRVIWTKSLPSDMQAAVVAKRDMPLDTLAEIADLVAENMRLRCARPSSAVSAVAAANPADERLRRLEDDVSLLKELVNNMVQLQASVYSAERNTRPRSRSHARSRSSSRARPEGWLCWHHFKYGPKANKCVRQCAFKPHAQQTSSRDGREPTTRGSTPVW